MSLPVNTENDDVYVIPEDTISLKKFPPKVRKVAKYILECESIPTWKVACEETGVDYDTFRTMISRAKKKGNDFQKFIEEQSTSLLKMEKLSVHSALLRGAVSDSHADRKLYYQLTGDLKEQTNIQHNITLNMGFIPASSGGQDTRKSGVIDTKPFIPSLPDKSK